jgi:glycosidase
LGKDNFYLVGEIAGGRANAYRTLEATGLDAALGIDEIPALLRSVVTGQGNPADYFRLFRNGPGDGPEDDLTWWCSRVVTFFDDHDQVGRSVKARFASEFGRDQKRAEKAVIAALGMNLTTIGVPCIYYGTEQGFDGHALGKEGGDRYIREAMFGGEFGSFGSRDHHFFNENSPIYKELVKILALRAERAPLRRGSQYLREISEDGKNFTIPEPEQNRQWQGLVAWSRVLEGEEIVIALNTDPEQERSAWVTVSPECHTPGSHPLKCLYSTDPNQVGTETSGPPEQCNGSAICLSVPPKGFAIFA